MLRAKITRMALAIAAVLVVLPTATSAQSHNAVIFGGVYDAAQKPVAGAQVRLENPAFEFNRTTITGDDGMYAFSEVPPAEGYRLTVITDGRVVDVKENITVTAGDEAKMSAIALRGYRPLGLAEIEDALTADFPLPRLVTLLNKYGVDFALTDKIEARLRKLGADDKVIIAILKNKK